MVICWSEFVFSVQIYSVSDTTVIYQEVFNMKAVFPKYTAAFCLLILFLIGCGGSGSVDRSGLPDSMARVAEESRTVSDFEFSVLSESFLSPDDHADLSMEVIEGSASTIVSVKAQGASQLRALYFQVLYDASRYSPVGVDIDPRFGNPEDLLSATLMQHRGMVQHGQIFIDPLESAGFSGNGVLAELRFLNKPANLLRTSSKTPSTSGSAAILVADSTNQLLRWGYASVGDYDQNLETNVADLTPIATRLQRVGPFAYFSADAVVDGDANGEINIADITPIGINFQNRVMAYNVYKTLDQGDYPAANEAASSIEPFGQVLFTESQGERVIDRLRFTFDVTGADPDAYYWVRPTDNFVEGTPSNIAAYGAVGIPLPEVDLQADQTTGEVPLTVNFDASGSSAPSSAITDYEWDLDGDGIFNETDNGEDGFQGSDSAQMTYFVSGSVDVSVLVTNDYNLSNAGSINIMPTMVPNQAPVASIVADVSSGNLPLGVNFDASASFDPDGSIVNYEWDFDGDGTYESSTGTSPFSGFVYETPGAFDPVVRVTDDMGAMDTASVSESGGTALDVNRAPVASIQADTLSGNLPLTVNFDASGSSDLDGSIVKYEWDFEGDGSFDFDSGASAFSSFSYLVAGDYDPTVRVTDNKGATDTAKLSETGGGGLSINANPLAAISADVLSGDLPLTVNFDASASSDSDGTIVSYEWDFDGDGTWDSDTGTTAIASHTYLTGGDYDPAVRVTDNDGARDTASISENGSGTITVNMAPTAALSASPLSGTLPLSVSFDASASDDIDGTIVKYEWDFDGDGSWDLDTGTMATTDFIYTDAGDFDPAVRVTDNDGATDTASLSDTVVGGITVNDPPVAAISGSPLSGGLPLLVNFDASSSSDSDGTIAKYEWDWEGDGIYDFDSGLVATADHTFLTAGTYDTTVRVTDDDGATDTAAISENGSGEITVLTPPLADITATPDSGAAPLLVSFDATGSTDPDGTVDLFEWDLDGNGSFETNTGSTGTVDSTYNNVGAVNIAVRVTDNDGLTDTASVAVTVTSGWSVGNVVLTVSLDSKVSMATFGTGTSARLGLAYKDASASDLMFIRTTDETGFNWGSPVAVQTSGQVGNDCTLANIDGYPGITFKRAQSKLDYIQATATDGSTWWANSIEIDGGGGAGAYTSLALIDGKPAASGIKSGQDKLRFASSTMVDGTVWNAPIDVDPDIGSEEMEFTDLAVVNGNPGILFNYVGVNTGLKFVRGTNASGSSFGSSVTVDAPTAGGRYPSLEIVNGIPAASYEAFAVSELRYCRAMNADGSSWDTPVQVDTGTNNGQWTTIKIVDGVPVIAYYDGGNGDLKFATSDDATGTSWTNIVIDNVGDVGKFATMSILNGTPVIAYYDVTNGQLKLAILVPAP
jgi:PKD repeat protein